MAESWLTDDRVSSIIKRAACAKRVRKESRVKGGHNPAGVQHKMVKTNPASTATTLKSPLTKQAAMDLVLRAFWAELEAIDAAD